MAEGKEGTFNDEIMRFLSGGFTAGVLGIYEREKIGANFMFGSFFFESLTLAEVSGTANTHQLPFLVAACDYSLIGEEIYAAGTYLSRNKPQIGSLVAQELGKYISITLIVAGSVYYTLKVQNVFGLLGGK